MVCHLEEFLKSFLLALHQVAFSLYFLMYQRIFPLSSSMTQWARHLDKFFNKIFYHNYWSVLGRRKSCLCHCILVVHAGPCCNMMLWYHAVTSPTLWPTKRTRLSTQTNGQTAPRTWTDINAEIKSLNIMHNKNMLRCIIHHTRILNSSTYKCILRCIEHTKIHSYSTFNGSNTHIHSSI